VITVGSGGTGTTTGAFQVNAGNGPYLGTVGTPVFFNGLAACNNNGQQCSGNFSYNWTFSDGTSSGPSTSNHTFSKTFSSAGNYTATLAVTDQTYNTTNSASEPVCISATGTTTTGTCTATTSNNGATTGSGQVTSNGVTDNPGGPYSGSSGTAITFTGTATSTNNGGQIVSYVWSFGDGSSGNGQSTTHTYNSSGNYTVALTVTDSTGVAVTATTTANVTAGQRKINLPQGCTNLASTFPDNTSTGTVVSNVNPTSAVLSVWEYNSAQAKFQGYLPGATQATDLPTVNHLDAIFICVNAAATFMEPSG
jgi:PKD repeat protein